MRYLIFTLSFFCCSCATVFNEDEVEVPVETDPPGARLFVGKLNTLLGEYISPARIRIPRGQGDFTLVIQKAGYRPGQITLKESTDWLMWLNLAFFGDAVGLLIDVATKDGYDIDPEFVRVKLVPL